MLMKILTGVLVATLLSAPAQAEVIRFDFEGIITGARDIHPLINAYFSLPPVPDFAEDVRISGFLEYDTALPPVGSSATSALYERGDFDIAINGRLGQFGQGAERILRD